MTIVVLSVAINFWQSYRSRQAAERLRASVTPTATVLRDGQWQEIPLRVVVPGDVFRLSAGDLVPADGRLDRIERSVRSAVDAHGRIAAGRQARSAAAISDETGPTRRISCFWARPWSAAPASRSPMATGPRTLFGDIAARLSVARAGDRVRARLCGASAC